MKIIDIPLSDIRVPQNRLRPVDEAHAKAIAVSIRKVGLIHPITVVKTPPATKSFKPYTLVAGAHRLRAAEMEKLEALPAFIAGAIGLDAQIVEVEENIARNDLTQIDRAVFIARRRELHEEEYGEIRRGGDAKRQMALWSDELESIAERIGLSKRTLQRADLIARNLDGSLLKQVRMIAAADNQSLIIKLAKMEPQRQKDIAKALRSGTPLDDAIADTDPAPKKKKSDAQKRVSAVLSNYAALAAKDRRAILQQIAREYPKDIAWALANPLDAEKA